VSPGTKSDTAGTHSSSTPPAQAAVEINRAGTARHFRSATTEVLARSRLCSGRDPEVKQSTLELPRFRHLDASGRKPGKGRFRLLGRGWRIPRSSAARPSELVGCGRKISDVAESLGVTKQSRRNWVKQRQLDLHERDDCPSSAEREELRRLHRENAPLKQETSSTARTRSQSSGRPGPSLGLAPLGTGLDSLPASGSSKPSRSGGVRPYDPFNVA
jgi:transposase